MYELGERKKEDYFSKDYCDLQKIIEASRDEQATILVSRPMVMIECKGFDEMTTKRNMCTALKDHLKLEDLKKTDIKILRAYRGTHTTNVTIFTLCE